MIPWYRTKFKKWHCASAPRHVPRYFKKVSCQNLQSIEKCSPQLFPLTSIDLNMLHLKFCLWCVKKTSCASSILSKLFRWHWLAANLGICARLDSGYLREYPGSDMFATNTVECRSLLLVGRFKIKEVMIWWAVLGWVMFCLEDP